jgi:hemerythrin-like metal-binding protein
MPNRVQWDSSFSVDNGDLDDLHRRILEQCGALADCCDAEPGRDGHDKFASAFEQLMALAREHFAAEAALLAGCGYSDLESYRHECEEYEYLAAEIVTTENFDKLELQRFLALWWIGHVMDGAKQHRPCLNRTCAG